MPIFPTAVIDWAHEIKCVQHLEHLGPRQERPLEVVQVSLFRCGAEPLRLLLKELRLGSNDIGDAGVDALVAVCATVQLCSLREVQLKHNPRISPGAKKRIQEAMAFVGGQARF